MFVINFDFSDYHYHFKFLLVSVPAIITELLTYPLQRVQTQLIIKPNLITQNQFYQSQLILRQMIGIQKFPKFFHGIRYSFDYSITQMTAKFFMFDWIMELTSRNQIDPEYFQNKEQFEKFIQLQQSASLAQQILQKVGVYAKCIVANVFGTFLSQSAFNYQVLASSLPVNARNRGQDVKQKLLVYTKSRKNIPLIGLKYTIPVSIYNTILEVFLIEKLTHFFNINQNSSKNYALFEFITAFSAFLATGFAFHYSYLRQVELIMNLKIHSISYTKGLFGTMIRHVLKGMSLYGLYFLWFQYKSKTQISEIFEKKSALISEVQSYRK